MLIAGAKSVSTVTLATPEAHEAGEELILDCDFDSEESEKTQLDLNGISTDPLSLFTNGSQH